MTSDTRAVTYSCMCPVSLELERVEARWEETLPGAVAIGKSRRTRSFPVIAVGLVRDCSADEAYRFVEPPIGWTEVRLGPGEELYLPFRLQIPWGIGVKAGVSVQMAVGGTVDWPPPLLQAPLELQPCPASVCAAETLARLTGTEVGTWNVGPSRGAAQATFRASPGRGEKRRFARVSLVLFREKGQLKGRLVLQPAAGSWRQRLFAPVESDADSIPFCFGSGTPEEIEQVLEGCLRDLRNAAELPLPASAPSDPWATLPRPASSPSHEGRALPRPSSEPERS